MAWSPQARAAAIAARKRNAHGRRKPPISNRRRRAYAVGAGAAALAVHRKTGRGVTRAPIVSAAIAAGATNAYLKRKQGKQSSPVARHGHHGVKVNSKAARLKAQKRAYNAHHQAKVAKFTKSGKYNQYKKTGLVRPGNTQGKTWHSTVHRYNKASKFNVQHGQQLRKFDRKIARASR